MIGFSRLFVFIPDLSVLSLISSPLPRVWTSKPSRATRSKSKRPTNTWIFASERRGRSATRQWSGLWWRTWTSRPSSPRPSAGWWSPRRLKWAPSSARFPPWTPTPPTARSGQRLDPAPVLHHQGEMCVTASSRLRGLIAA